jgi:hypothetical protein
VVSEAGVEIPGMGVAAPWSDIAAVVYQTRLHADQTSLMVKLATMEASRALAARPQLIAGIQASMFGAGGFAVDHLLIRGNPDDAVLAAYGFGGPELVRQALHNLPQAVVPGESAALSQQVASLGSDGS